MNEAVVLEVMQSAIMTVIMVAAPPLLLGLIVGVLVSLFQTITSIQEATLAFVPKILAVFLALIIFGPWMLTILRDFIEGLYNSVPIYLLQ